MSETEQQNLGTMKALMMIRSFLPLIKEALPIIMEISDEWNRLKKEKQVKDSGSN